MDLENYIMYKKNQTFYIEKSFNGTKNEYMSLLNNSGTLYVSNIDPSIKEFRLWHLFGLCGEIKRIIPGVNKKTKVPCGFAFVEFYNPKDAKEALHFFKGFFLDGKKLDVDLDIGFVEGRQYGRGTNGGQLCSESYSKKSIRK